MKEFIKNDKVIALAKKALKDGMVSFEEVNELLKDDFPPEKIEELLAGMEKQGIKLVKKEELEKKLAKKAASKKIISSEKGKEGEKEKESGKAEFDLDFNPELVDEISEEQLEADLLSVSKSIEVNRMVQTVQSKLGGVDILVNNAGIARVKTIEDITESDWDEAIDVNLKSAFIVTQAVVTGMRERVWGRIINISSGAAHTGGHVGPHYTASKAGMEGLTRGYASRLVKEGITVNTIAPALIETDMVTRNLQVTPEVVPVGRFGVVEEVAQVIVMLAQNGYITGQTINVNGGWHMS